MRYHDSGVLVKLYVPEAGTSAAVRAVAAGRAPVPFTALHDLEVRNALRLKLFRGEISQDELGHALAAIDEDRRAGRLRPCDLDWPAAFAAAAEASARSSAGVGTRSLDLLHIGVAMSLGCREFVSADDRQLCAAVAAGLTAIDLRRVS